MNKPDGFIGQAALQAQKAQGLSRRLVQFALTDPTPLLYHNEPILRDGEIVGRITSGMFGHALGQSLGMGYVSCRSVDDKLLEGRYEIEVAGKRVAATPSLQAFYDPQGLRIKA